MKSAKSGAAGPASQKTKKPGVTRGSGPGTQIGLNTTETKNILPSRNGRVATQKSGLTGGASDSQSGVESFGEDFVERDAFWGLVRLFIMCHEGENKDFTEKGGDFASANQEAKAGKSGAKQSGKHPKCSKHSQVSNEDQRVRSAQPQSNQSNKGGAQKSSKGSTKKKGSALVSGSHEILEEGKELVAGTKAGGQAQHHPEAQREEISSSDTGEQPDLAEEYQSAAQLVDSVRGMLNSDEEMIQFFQDKMKVFEEKILEISQVWQVLQTFKVERDYLHQIELQNKTSLLSPQ